MFGYMGKILRVNLSDGAITTQEIDTQMALDYIGGTGFISKIIYEEVPAKSDPLGTENRLVFMTGPVTGTRYPTSGRYMSLMDVITNGGLDTTLASRKNRKASKTRQCSLCRNRPGCSDLRCRSDPIPNHC